MFVEVKKTGKFMRFCLVVTVHTILLVIMHRRKLEIYKCAIMQKQRVNRIHCASCDTEMSQLQNPTKFFVVLATVRGVLLVGAAVAVHRARNCMSWIYIKEQKVIKTWMLSISSSKNAGLHSAGKLKSSPRPRRKVLFQRLLIFP